MIDPAAPKHKRYVEPVAIMFSEYYFYLIGYIVEVNKNLEIISEWFEYPAIYRVDRIESFQLLDKHFCIPYRKRFEDGEFRKRVQFMYPGQLMSMELRYTGKSVEAILDRLPTARIVHQDADGYTIKAEVYGKGILMWLMSQGEFIEILAPESLRTQMREHLKKLCNNTNRMSSVRLVRFQPIMMLRDGKQVDFVSGMSAAPTIMVSWVKANHKMKISLVVGC